MVSAKFINKHNKISEITLTDKDHKFLSSNIKGLPTDLSEIDNMGIDISINKKFYYLFYPDYYKNKVDNKPCKIIVMESFINSDILCAFLDPSCVMKDFNNLNDNARFIIKKRAIFSPVILFHREYKDMKEEEYFKLIEDSKIIEYLPHNFVPTIIPSNEEERKKIVGEYYQYLCSKGYTDIDTMELVDKSINEIYIKRNKIYLDHLYSHTTILNQNIPLPLIIFWDTNRDTNANSEEIKKELARDYASTIPLFRM